LPQLNNTDVVVASASNPSIPSSILQDFTLDEIPFSVSFFLTQEGYYNVFGNLTFGDLSVVDVPTPTPLPAALPLFAAALAAMGLVFSRGNRDAKARGA